MSACVFSGADIIRVAAGGVWGGAWATASRGEIRSPAIRDTMEKREALVIGAGSVSEKEAAEKCVSVRLMDKKEINSTKLTVNFLVWIGVFVLLLFALLAHFVWRIF